MKLRELTDLLTTVQVNGDPNVEIKGIKMNSKHVHPGDLFICVPGIPGFQEDRHQFAEDAVKAGASALVVEREITTSVPTVMVPDARYAMDGLENVLSTVKGFATKKVITVFGCGGDRDRTKRPVIGSIAAKYSDFVIATSDNPRSEDPDRILKDIENGLTRGKYELINDRRQAIAHAISIAENGDVVIIAGKGHETYQILKNETVHFDDRDEIKIAIRNRTK